MAGIAAEDDDAVGQQHGLFDVVGDDEDGAGGHGLLGPQLQQFAAQVLGGEHVEGGEGLVHEEHFGLDHQGARKADALAHAAGKLLGIGGFKAVQAHHVEHAHAALAALVRRHAAGLQRGLDVFKHGEPGKQGKALEHDGDVDLGLADGLSVPVDLAGGGPRQSGEHAQHGGFARAGGAQQGQDLAGDDVQVGGRDDLDAVFAGLRIILLNLLGANDGFAGAGAGIVLERSLLHATISGWIPEGCRWCCEVQNCESRLSRLQSGKIATCRGQLDLSGPFPKQSLPFEGIRFPGNANLP